jgi:hypothetical protein
MSMSAPSTPMSGRLRKALGRDRDLIRTVRGSGYSTSERFASTTATAR